MIKQLLTTAILTSSLFSLTLTEQKEFDLVQSIIPGTKIEKVKQSPLTGVYETYFEDGSLIYIVPSKRLLIMGEIYTSTGRSLTQKSIKEYKSKNKIIDPLTKSINSLKPNTKENQTYLKQLVQNGIQDGVNINSKYKIVVLKSLTCPNCTDLDNYLKTKQDITIYIYLAPSKQSEDIYKEKYKINKPTEKLKTQLELIRKRLKGFGVPFALIIDDNYNLVDTIHGFDRTKWDKYTDTGAIK